MQARPGVSRVPGAQLEAPQVMPDPDEDQVALANFDLLIPLGGGQVLALLAAPAEITTMSPV